MVGKKVVQAIRPGVHEPLHLRGAPGVVGLKLRLADVEAGAQVLPDRLLAFRLGGSAEVCKIIGLDPREVVLGLSVDHAKDGIGVGVPVDVRYAPVVPRDHHVRGFGPPSRELGR